MIRLMKDFRSIRPDFLQIFQHFFGRIAAFVGMVYQFQAMRTGGMFQFGISLKHCFYNIEAPEHGSAKDVHARAFGKQEFSDFAIAHMPCGFERGFKIAATLVPGSIEQLRFLHKQFLHTGKIRMGFADPFLDQLAGKRVTFRFFGLRGLAKERGKTAGSGKCNKFFS